MSAPAVASPFPKGALFGAVGLIVLTVISAGTSRLLGTKQDRPAATALMARDLRFEDREDGGVAVIDATTGAPVDVLAPGTNGFVRASLRSLAKRRQFEGESSSVFHLTAWSDGRLTLDDPASGNPIELEAFGQTNAMAFAKLLTEGTRVQ